MNTDGAERRGAENAEKRRVRIISAPLCVLRASAFRFVIRVHLCLSVVKMLGVIL